MVMNVVIVERQVAEVRVRCTSPASVPRTAVLRRAKRCLERIALQAQGELNSARIASPCWFTAGAGR